MRHSKPSDKSTVRGDHALRWSDDRGSASLEFITVGMILLIPLVYLVVAVSSIQAGALAVEGAARQAARVFVQSDDPVRAQSRAATAVDFALADHGIEPDAATTTVTCTPRPADCLNRQGFVTVTVSVSVPLPLVPPVLVGDFPLVVPVTGTATQHVSRFSDNR
ncbi:MAG: TadE family protein [Rhodoglobus sp.]